MATGNLDTDQKVDAVVALGTNGLQPLEGDKKGSFAANANLFTLTPTSNNASVNLADIDTDGDLDVVTNTVVVLGNGDGTFGTPKALPFAGATFATFATLAYIDTDSFLDVVASTTSTINVALGNGDGTFRVTATQTNVAAGRVAVGDVDNDTRADIVTAAGLVLRGNADGTFAASPGFASLPSANDVLLATLDADDVPDIVVGDATTVKVFLTAGSGVYVSPPSIAVNGALFLSATDINQDGKVDIVAGAATTITVLFGDGAGGFKKGPVITAPQTISSVNAGDVNSDGYPDILATSAVSSSVYVWLSTQRSECLLQP